MDTLRLLFVAGQCMKNVNLFISLVSIYIAKGYSSSSFQRFCWQKNCKPNQKRCLCNLNVEVPQGKSNFLLKLLQCPASLTAKGIGKKWIFNIFLGSYHFLSLLGYDHSLKVPKVVSQKRTWIDHSMVTQPFCTRGMLCLLWSFKAMVNLDAKRWWQLCKTLSKVVRSAGTERLGAPGHTGNACIVESPSYTHHFCLS